jgi:uncharacterized MAPEG superfamily protein
LVRTSRGTSLSTRTVSGAPHPSHAFPFFAAAVLIAEAAGVHDALTHWGAIAYLAGRLAYTALYIAGIPLIRSLFWNVAAFGMLAILTAPFLSR